MKKMIVLKEDLIWWKVKNAYHLRATWLAFLKRKLPYAEVSPFPLTYMKGNSDAIWCQNCEDGNWQKLDKDE